MCRKMSGSRVGNEDTLQRMRDEMLGVYRGTLIFTLAPEGGVGLVQRITVGWKTRGMRAGTRNDKRIWSQSLRLQAGIKFKV